MHMIKRRMLHRALLVGALMAASLATGCGSPAAQQPALGDTLVKSADVATQSGPFQGPLDSTPDPDAATIYFTAGGPDGPGIFRVPAAGGAAEPLASGAPLVRPVGIAIGGDGRQLYVADPEAGEIFALPVTGGVPAPIQGASGSAPRGLDVVSEQGRDMIYFTGKAPGDGQPAVLKLPVSGGAPTVVAKGAPLVEPDGVTVTRAGVAYVSDRAAGGGGAGSVFKIDGGTVTKIVEQVRVGDPAGVALTKDESVLLVSALQPDRASDQVLLVNLSTLQTGSVTQGIAQNQKAGGVHRARNSNTFAWADLSAGGAGRVYRIVLH